MNKIYYITDFEGVKMTNNNIQSTVKELQKLLDIENFIGDPIEAEGRTLIPVMRVGFGFGTGQKGDSEKNTDIVGAGAGAELVSMVVVPKEGESGENIRVINLTSGTELNKALNDIGLMVTNLINEYVIKPKKEDDEYDEAEYIEPTTKIDETN